MSLHQQRLTPTQQASFAHRARFEAKNVAAARALLGPPASEIISGLRADLQAALRAVSEQTATIANRENTVAILEQQNRALREQNAALEKHFGLEVKVNRIITATAAKFGVTAAAIKSNRRDGWIMQPRHTAMYMARRLTNKSLPEIGLSFGGRDHTTILHATRKITDDITTDAELAAKIAELVAELGDDQ